MIEQSSEQILKQMLHHGMQATFKALIHKSFRNLIQITESISAHKKRALGLDDRLSESVAYSLKEALALENRNN
jgi:hypothetical protein